MPSTTSFLRLHRSRPLVLATVLLVAGLTAVLTAWSVAPDGRRAAPATRPPAPLTVVGLGDSVTAGTACDCTDYVTRYAAQVPPAAGGPAHAVNLGVGGLTSSQLLSDLDGQGPLPLQVAGADVVLVTVGANDLVPLQDTWAASGCPAACSSPAVQTVARNVTGVVKRIEALRGGHPTRILVTDYWNVFEDGDVASADHGPAYLAWSDDLSRQLNTALCSAAEGAGATCVDLYAPFKGDGGRNPTALLAGDGDHPNAAGHDLIAAALLRASRF